MVNYRSVASKVLLFTCLLGDTSWAITSEGLLQVFHDLEDFSHYSARPVQTASREEALETLEKHFSAMSDYHKEMINMYENQKNLSVRAQNPDNNLKEFLSTVLGFDLPEETPPISYINDLIARHTRNAIIWGKKTSALTGENFSICGMVGRASEVLLPTLENSDHLAKNSRADFDALFSTFANVRKNPEKHINNKLVLSFIDELWALRHAHALMLPWTRSDEDIQHSLPNQVEQKQSLTKQDKNRLKRQRYRANKRAKQDAQAVEVLPVENGSSFDSVESLPLQKEKELNPVAISLEVKEPLIKVPPIIKAEESVDNVDHFDPEAFRTRERQKSFEKKQMKEEKTREDHNNQTNTPQQPLLPSFQVDKESYYAFIDLFNGQNIAFKAFVKAFKNGLQGRVYKNKGGSIRTFQHEKSTFNLHKPHGGKKGKAMFYDDLRQYAVRKLGELGVTKDTLLLKQ